MRSGVERRSVRSGASQASGFSGPVSSFSKPANIQRSYSDSGRTSSAAAPISATAVKAPPGYSGYVPGVYAGNVYGHTFARATKHASRDLNTYRGGNEPDHQVPSRRYDSGN